MVAKAVLAGIRVLVIEDEPLISMYIEDSLSDLGCETVATAANLTDAIHKASAVLCDIIMLDVNLSGKQTFGLAESLFEKHMPFIFSTGYGNPGIPLHLQYVPVLQKPFKDSELKEKLEFALAAARV